MKGENVLAPLVGRTVDGSPDRRRLAFLVRQNDAAPAEAVVFFVESDDIPAYVHEVDAPDVLVGQIVRSSAARFVETDFGDATFYTASTDRGTCTIELRCEHNGWYGGNLAEAPREPVLVPSEWVELAGR